MIVSGIGPTANVTAELVFERVGIVGQTGKF
jgi:hypothetical protein